MVLHTTLKYFPSVYVYVSYQSCKSAWTCNVCTRSFADSIVYISVTDQYELPMEQQCCRWHMVLYGCAMTTSCPGFLQGFVIEFWMDMAAQHCLHGSSVKWHENSWSTKMLFIWNPSQYYWLYTVCLLGTRIHHFCVYVYMWEFWKNQKAVFMMKNMCKSLNILRMKNTYKVQSHCLNKQLLTLHCVGGVKCISDQWKLSSKW